MQTLGGAIFVSAGEGAFLNVVKKKLLTTAPTVNPAQVIATGATELRSVFPAEVIPGILRAYMDGLKTAFEIVTITAGLTFLISLANKWRNLKGLRTSTAGAV